MKFTRYAVFYTFEPGQFADLATGILGWDSRAGQHVGAPDIKGLPEPLHTLTKRPRKYGLHATLKPPFALADPHTEHYLRMAVRDLAGALNPAMATPLTLDRIGRFLALRQTFESEQINEMAAQVVKDLDPFRAPLTDAQIAQRRPDRLTDHQRHLLDTWGYPFVLDEFQFHITLTGPLKADQIDAVQTALQEVLAPMLPLQFHLDAVSLMGEDAEGMFHLIERFALTQQACR